MLFLSLALGLGGLYLVAGSALFDPGTYRLRDPSAGFLAAGAAALVAQWAAPGFKVMLLCRGQGTDLAYRPALLVHLVGVLGAALTPNNTGGVPATVAGLGRLGVPVGKGIGVVTQIFLLDLVFFAWSAPLGLGFLVYSGTLSLPVRAEVLTGVAVLLAIGGAVLLGRKPQLVVRLILAAARLPVLRRFDERLRGVARDYNRSARAYLKLPAAAWLALHAITAIGWISGFVLLWSLLGLYGVDASLPATLALLSSLTLLSTLVPTPGGSGFIEAAVGLAVGASAGAGAGVAAAVLLWRLLGFYLIFALGPVAGWLLYLSGGPPTGGEASAKAPKPGPG
jgi:glycosyltransferase 2 family protein